MIRNGEKLGYPYLEAIKSVLPICDEFVIVVGKSEDDTRQNIVAIGSPKIKIIDTVWDENLREGGAILAQQTDIAFQSITGDWGFYLQGDEVLHEKYLETVAKAMQKHKDEILIEGLLFKYNHFYGSYDYVAAARRWYRHEIRVVRNDKTISSYRDAQGFRKNGKKLNVKSIDAQIYHYGWCRPPEKQQLKQESFQNLYHDDSWVKENVVAASAFDYSTFQKLERFKGTHPEIMQARIAKINWHFSYNPAKMQVSFKDKFILWVEKWFGFRPFEYKNYKIL